ncbi:MAG: ABC transporter substrate-binding protein [Rhodospirillaceae bacterium]|nr:ABC transporter substrate-binding protein [Rhodospirillaceae bacterium]
MIRWFLAAALSLGIGIGPAAAKNTLRWASQYDMQTADPHAQHEPATDAANLNIFDPLVRRSAREEIEPGLAVSWRTIDPVTWEFRLRTGVRFHDGTPFTADDVVFSIRRAKAQNSDFIRYVADIASVTKIDDHTIRIVTRTPDPILPGRLTRVCIMSKVWAEKHKAEQPQDFANKQNTYASRNANGTGPFVLKKFEPGVETVLARNPAWWGWSTPQGGGNLDEVVHRTIRSALRRANALHAGEIDFVPDPAAPDLDRMRKDVRLKVLQAVQIRTIFLGMDQGSPELRSADVKGSNPFADKRVRQAMQLAIDLQTIKRVVMRGASAPAGIVIAPGVRGYTAALDKPVVHNLDAGKALMKQAGYAAGFTVRFDCPNDRYVNDEQICQAIVGMLGRLGVRAQLFAAPKEQHFARIRKTGSDLFLLGWGVPTYDSHYVLSYLYATRGEYTGLWNATGYSNKKLDDLIARMAVEIDVKKRDALIAEAWALAKADLVYIPLHHQLISWALAKTVDLPITADDEPHFRWARIAPGKR